MSAKATVEAIIDWVITNNEVIWGEGFHTLLGFDLKEKNFRLWSDNIHADDRKKVLGDLRKTLLDATKHQFNAEFRFVKADGDIAYVQHRGVFIRDANGKATRALGAMIDLTESLNKIRRIVLQEKALKEIAWTQSHIVRAPLANLMGLVGLIKNNVTTGISDELLLGYISDSAEKLDGVIRDVVIKATEVDDNHNVRAPVNLTIVV
jgi:PAS domain S-box-containing protein